MDRIKRLILAVSLLLLPSASYGYSGNCAIWSQKRNAFISSNFAGTQAGFDAAKAAVGTNGSIFIYGGCEGSLTIGTLQDSVFVYAYDSAKWTVYAKAGSIRDRSGQARLDIDSLGVTVRGTGIIPRLGPASSAGSGGAIRIVDGVTFLATAAGLQAAVDDLPALGGDVWVMSPITGIATTITLGTFGGGDPSTGKSVRLFLNGYGAMLEGTANPILKIVNRVTIQGLGSRQTYIKSTTTTNDLVLVDGTSVNAPDNVQILGVGFLNGNRAIKWNPISQGTLTDLFLSDQAGNAIELNAIGDLFSATDIMVNNPGNSAIRVGVRGTSGEMSIHSCVFRNWFIQYNPGNTTATAAMWFESDSVGLDMSFTNLIIDGVEFLATPKEMIRIAGTGVGPVVIDKIFGNNNCLQTANTYDGIVVALGAAGSIQSVSLHNVTGGGTCRYGGNLSIGGIGSVDQWNYSGQTYGLLLAGEINVKHTPVSISPSSTDNGAPDAYAWTQTFKKKVVMLDSLRVNKGLYVGGRFMSKWDGAAATLNFGVPATVPGSVDLTITIAGAALGDRVFVAAPITIGANYILTGFVSAANTVTVRWTQIAGAAAEPDGAGGTYEATLVKN